MIAGQQHRGPDGHGSYEQQDKARLGHTRLKIIDLSENGKQPMSSADGRYWIVFNGEIYNYVELRRELDFFTFKSKTDTEVILAAFLKWGTKCLDRFIGMFAFAIWDAQEECLFAARDRFGVKPFFYTLDDTGTFLFASEIKAFEAAGISRKPDEVSWATYLQFGMYDHCERTFTAGVSRLLPGCHLKWSWREGLTIVPWYDPADAFRLLGEDLRAETEVEEELQALLEETIMLRFRSDVEVGVCLSGGLDSSLLMGLIKRIYGDGLPLRTFTFVTGDAKYDETPYVERMLRGTGFTSQICRLDVIDVPTLVERMWYFQDEPYGGLPTLGMSKVYERAKETGCIVLLDGNGLDEGWAGYDYYLEPKRVSFRNGPVQGARGAYSISGCLCPDFRAMSEPAKSHLPDADRVRRLQYRDLRFAKIPRATRFSDRVSMMYSRELREPFLDHRIVELGLRQPLHRKINHGSGKWLLRRIAKRILPERVVTAPKRPVQTPQREWLQGPLADWAEVKIESAIRAVGGKWLDPAATRELWKRYLESGADNSFPIWQCISIGIQVEYGRL